MFAFQISSPSLVIARWQRQSVHNTYKWGLLATAACYVPLLYMTTYHKSLLFVNKNVSSHSVPMWCQIAGSWEQTLRTSLTSILITSFLKNSRCLSLHSRGLPVPAPTTFGPMCCRKVELIHTQGNIRKMFVDVYFINSSLFHNNHM